MAFYYSKKLLMCTFASVIPTALAGTMPHPVAVTTPLSTYQSVYTLNLGPAWNMGGDTQTIYLEPDLAKTYAGKKNSLAFLNAELFLGLEKSITHHLKSQLGLAIAGTSNTELSGNIWEDANPEFNNYTYTYNINHAHVALKGELLADVNYYIKPYINASIGVGFNRASTFIITPDIYQEVAAPGFQSNTQTAFTYTIGAGFQKTFNQTWRAGIGYEFADWGQSQLNRAPGQTQNTGISLSHLYVNSLLLNISYLR